MSAAAVQFTGDEILPRISDSAALGLVWIPGEYGYCNPRREPGSVPLKQMRRTSYIDAMAKNSSTLALKTRRADAVFVCGKCLKRSDGGGKLKRRLKKQLSEVSDARNCKRPKLVLTGCLGICPKHAVVTASAATLGRGEVVVLRDSRAESVEKALALLTPHRRGT